MTTCDACVTSTDVSEAYKVALGGGLFLELKLASLGSVGNKWSDDSFKRSPLNTSLNQCTLKQ